MYLRHIYIENSGPVEFFNFEIPVNEATGAPRPLVLVGLNGTGKTNLLSIIGDSLYEAAATHYRDITPTGPGGDRPLFRVIGGGTRTYGAFFGVSILEYEHEGASYLFGEKAGDLSSDYLAKLPETLRPAVSGLQETNDKKFEIPPEVVRKVLDSSSFLYFPSNRSETPHWLNVEALGDLTFETRLHLDRFLDRPIYLERTIRDLEQWMLSIIVDMKMEIQVEQDNEGRRSAYPVGDVDIAMEAREVWEGLNAILRTIMNDSNAKLGLGQRNSPLRLGFVGESGRSLPLSSLSAGQSTLLSIFGTIMRYGDRTGARTGFDARAICVIDEIDAHMHIDLQSRALPALMRMFPFVQFIVSAHSPFFLLGLGDDTEGLAGPVLLEMPGGQPVAVEAFSEFGHALTILRDTNAFNQALAERIAESSSNKLLVLCEGETDPEYLIAAATRLQRARVVDRVEFECIGTQGSQGAINTGRKALDSLRRMVDAKPDLIERPLLLLYDNDTGKSAENLPGDKFVRMLPTNPSNSKVRTGIENLLPEAAITDDVFFTKFDVKDNGTRVKLEEIDKVALCNQFCDQADAGSFVHFAPALDLVEEVLDSLSPPYS